MILLILCSIVGGAVTILRALGLRKDLITPPLLQDEVVRMNPVSDNPLGRLQAMLQRDQSPLGRILKVALGHLEVPRSENQEAVQVVARGEIVKLEQGLFILEILVGITPLLGLLGAVSGLVKVFGAFGTAEGQGDPRVIAAGISEALESTVVGLAIAIPCLIAYSFFVRKVETIASEMEGTVSSLLSKCYIPQPGRADEKSAEVPAP